MRQKRIILSSFVDFSFIICIFVAELLVQYRTTNYMKHTTIIDIAKELGISKSTVSRALSGDTHNVKPETMRLINETATRMGVQGLWQTPPQSQCRFHSQWIPSANAHWTPRQPPQSPLDSPHRRTPPWQRLSETCSTHWLYILYRTPVPWQDASRSRR